MLYNWAGATNSENTSIANQQQNSDGSDPIASPIRGICPKDWHVPSDKEWNDLEREIYTNPVSYSTYRGASAVFIPVWNSDWETQTSSRGSNENSATNPGHGHAMVNTCKPIGSTVNTNGKSLSAKRGGLDFPLVGQVSAGASHSYGQVSYIWSSSSGTANNGAWFRHFRNGESSVLRLSYLRLNIFNVRCKKDK